MLGAAILLASRAGTNALKNTISKISPMVSIALVPE